MNLELIVHAPSSVLITEATLCLLLCGLLLYFRKQVSGTDALAWSIVWLTRVLASINGSYQLHGSPAAQAWYLGLQACAAIALIVMLVRMHTSAVREKWGKRVVLRLALSGLQPAPSHGSAHQD